MSQVVGDSVVKLFRKLDWVFWETVTGDSGGS
jgi:hypothetical protein